ncbi:MAG TPA: acyl-CoA desaturase [Acidothermaceae bacterium]
MTASPTDVSTVPAAMPAEPTSLLDDVQSTTLLDDEGLAFADGSVVVNTPSATTRRETAPSSAERRPSEYSQLSHMIKDAGLLERRKGYYWARIAVNVVLLAGAGVGFYLASHTWWVLVLAVYCAIVSTQLAFTGHEAGHRQMFRSRRANELAGYLHGNLMIGLSYDWWVDKHNRHHRNPNQSELDPDVGTGAFVFSHDDMVKRGRVGRYMAQYQAFFFFPLLALESLNLQVASIRAVAKTGARNRGIEAVLLFIHVTGYITLLLLTMSPLQALAFLGVHQALFGIYLGCSFAPNHKGMRMLTKDEEMDFLRRQVLTSRNVTGGVPVGMLLGGLNWQIEHHLFPSMPRPNLRRAVPIVREFCENHGLPYAEANLYRSYQLAMGHLHDVGTSAGPQPSSV